MIVQEACKILGVSINTPKEAINRIYLQRREYFEKQLQDLESLPHLIPQREKFNSEFKSLNEAFITLGGIVHGGSNILQSRTLKERFVSATEKINRTINSWRDKFLDFLKKIPGILFFTMILVMLIVLFIVIFKNK